MYSIRKKVYAEDLLEIIKQFRKIIYDVKNNLGDKTLINEGLFAMANAMLEDSTREIMKVILCSFPEKLYSKSCCISKNDIIKITDEGYEIIIDNELYALFKNGLEEQLKRLFLIINNLEYKKMDQELKDCILKCGDISLYRNVLIHNGKKITSNFNENVKIFKIQSNISKIIFSKELVEKFVDEYLELFNKIEEQIIKTYPVYSKLSKIDRIKTAWEKCFKSPILKFENYWDIDNKNDLIKGIKYSNYEESISSSEEILLSIWRHQYDSSIPTKDFLICSIDHIVVSELYKDLFELKFYYMKERSENFYTKNSIIS